LSSDPSLIQLHLSKNVFQVVDRVSRDEDHSAAKMSMGCEPLDILKIDFKEAEGLVNIFPNQIVATDGQGLPDFTPLDNERDDTFFSLK